MKKRFTRILAALALLVGLTIPMGVWGQTETEVVAYTLQPASGTNNNYASNCDITINGITWNLTGNSTIQPWRIGGKSLNGVDRPLYSKTAISDNISKIEVTHGAASSITINSWTVIVASDASFNTVVSTLTPAFAANSTTTINRPDGVNWSNCYYKFVYNVTVSGTSNKFLEFTQAKFYKEEGTNPVIAFDPTSISLGDNNPVNTEITKTFTVSQANLENGITLSVNGHGAVNPATIAKDADPTVVTWTYTPTAAGTISATVTATSGYTEETLEITGAAVAPVSGYTIDFESAASVYTDWTFDNMTSKQTGNVTAHGGTYYGTTGGKASAAIVTKTAVATPYSMTCYVTKQSGNTTASTWTIQVSEDGSTWTDVATQDATSMSQGTWVEFTADLSQYTNVYVRVYYSGSTAVRNIDDLTISTEAPAVAAPTFDPAAGTYEEVKNVTITCTTTGSTIYYTTDGTTPTSESTVYTEPIVVAESTTIKAIAYVGEQSSTVATAEYVINLPTVATPTFTPAGGTYTEAQSVSIACATDGATIYYTTDGTVPTTSSSVYSSAINISETTTVKAMAVKAGMSNSEIATATYTIVTPMTIAAVRAQGTGDVITTGIITYISGKNAYIQDATAAICVYVNTSNFWTSSSYAVGDEICVSGSLSIYQQNGNMLEITPTAANVSKLSSNNELPFVSKTIAEINADNFSDLQCMRVKIENATVQSVSGNNNTIAQGENTILVYSSNLGVSAGDVITSFFANVGNYQGNLQLVNPTDVVIQENTNPVINATNPETLAYNATSGAIAYTIDNPVAGTTLNATTTADWISNIAVGNESVTFTTTVNEGNADRYATITLTYGTVTKDVTVTQGHYVAPFAPVLYTRATSITSGQHYIIVGFNNDDHDNAYAMGEQKTNNRGAVLISEDGNCATVINENVYDFVITSEGDYYSIYDAVNEGYLYAANNGKNWLMTESGLTVNSKWEITFDATTGAASVVATQSSNRNVMQFNYASNNQLFSCYSSASQKPVYLYVKSDETPVNSTLTINGYTSDDSKAGYYLIASPVTVNPATVGMTTGDFDLYYYDANEELEWRNYEAESFNLVPGKGYLYAKKGAGQTYEFPLTGAPYNVEDIQLIQGWNLVGNPYAQTAYITGEYYVMDAVEGVLTPGDGGEIAAMQGIFVNAEQAGTMTFSTTAPNNGKSASVVMNLTRNRGNLVDRAIVRFGDGDQLPKFQIFENSTKIYVTEGNQDFAVVRSANQADMPVSFKASENGTYTLNIEAENVNMNYLHLIDNLTGMDVDLLQTPSYTFNAKKSDYASRFKLVFSANEPDGPSTGSGSFAYYNGSEWQISNLGEATLQVIDVTGRIVKNETISGNASISINEAPGVYMMRLVSGNDVKVQKVVVR